MVVIDYNGIALGAIVTQKGEISEDMVRHMILNTIRMYNKKFRAKYGQVVIACDGGSWRKEVFPQYKWKRKQARADDKGSMDWNAVFEILNKIRDELSEYFHYKVVYVPGVEADDIIATLVEGTQEFGNHEDVMIVSADKDFIQLQKYNNIRQFSPMTKKFIQEKDPQAHLMEHLFKGDASDGIPNILSHDNVFVEGERQKPVTQKKMAVWLEGKDNLRDTLGEELYRNFVRNKKLIDLSEIPEDVKTSIIDTYNGAKVAPKMRILNYLIKNKCRNLIDCVGDFH